MWRSRNSNFTFQLERSRSDPKGRFIICAIKTNERVFTLATIYAPNDDDPAFFESFFRRLQDFHCDNIMLGGNLGKDKKGGLAKKPTQKQLMQSTSTLQNLTWLIHGGFLTLTS